jgi:ABC-2 type transport system ATP-binding protein
MIEIRGLVKRYGPVTAIDGVTFTVRSGVVTGFVGGNGAGKSTTMRILLGLSRADSGMAYVNGRTYRELRRPLREIGGLLEPRAFHPGRSGRDHLLALGASHGIGTGRVDTLLELVGLGAAGRCRAGTYSLGMAQRLGIATALLGDPATLVLDEPANGLDPGGIRWLRNLLREWAAQGRTVLLSSHVISEVAVTADRLVMIGNGRVLADAATAELARRYGSVEDAYFEVAR